MRDLILGVDVIDVGRELTLLAEVCLGVVVGAALEAAARRFGPSDPQFAVLGLGKFGGYELGYGSDLDLVFVYESGKSIPSGMACVEYFSFVASQIIKTLKEPTRYGSLYDVDARLRPDGRKGTLVISDERLRQYYVEEAQPWERLALVKVRAVAGHEDFARRVEELARELAFGLPLNEAGVANIEEVRTKIVASSTRSSLKKDEGGLAELEFAVRLLQLRSAPHAPGVRRGDVLGAIDALVEIGALDKQDAQSLRDTYLLFRRIENRLRIRQGRSTSRLPEDAAARSELARRLGIEGDLGEVVRAHKQRVHEIYRRVRESAASRK
jgi:glutamate-ammonia-ligase adenylyltransferase